MLNQNNPKMPVNVALNSINTVSPDEYVAITINDPILNEEELKSSDVYEDTLISLDENNALSEPSQQPSFNVDCLYDSLSPDEEVIEYVEQIFKEQKQNPSRENLCKGLYKTVYLCLGSREANIYNSSKGFPSVFNAVASTEPETFGSVSRLQIYTGAELFLFTALHVASIMKTQYPQSAWEKVDEVARYCSSLSNGFNFAYSVADMIVARIMGSGNLPGNSSTYEALSYVLASSLATGIVECYAQSKPLDNKLRKASDMLIFALTVGNMFGQSQRIYHFFPDAPAPSSELQGFFAWGPLMISAASLLSAACFRRNDMTFTARLGTVNNLLLECGTLLAANQVNAYYVYLLISAKLLVSIGSNTIIHHLKKKNASASMSEPLLNQDEENEQKEASSEIDSDEENETVNSKRRLSK